MSLDDTGTALVIRRRSDNAALLTLYSSRDLTQTLDFIGAAKQFDLSVNGALMNLSHPQFLRFESTITCTDQRPPALDAITPGLPVTVDCVCELSFPVGDAPSRTVVDGSSYTEGDFVFYRPRLNMWILDPGNSLAEWQALNSWTMKLQEDGS